MTDEQGTQAHTDFFISYTSTDRTWAEWIAWQLEAAGYTTIIQAWDFRPGFNFVAQMEQATTRAERTLLVLSPAYLASDFTFAEWAAAFRRDPRGKQGTVLPVRIEACELKGLLGLIGYIDLVNLDEHDAQAKLLKGVKRERPKPLSVSFPGTAAAGSLRDRPAFPGSLPPIWTIPFPQNPFFTGREEVLAELASSLQRGQPTALSQPQAISGLGGIGKTQLALEYAYRHRGDYQAVLWALADTRESLIASYLAFATLLDLPERNEQDSERVIAAVKTWLQHHPDWLLILDNADDLALAGEFLPPGAGGHILLTTRAQATGRLAHRLEVQTLPSEMGALFLLRRAKRLAPDTPLEQASEKEREQARAICEELGGLPLALDQAGAYIEETQCSLADYLQQYQTQQAALLKRRGSLSSDYPYSVATTWSLAFTRVEAQSPPAADLLRLCAFLAPEAIPEAILTEGAKHLGPHLAPVVTDPSLLNQAIAVLGAYSLLQRDPTTHTLSLHRLVQAVLRQSLSRSQTRTWQRRTLHAVAAATPKDVQDIDQWPFCERWLPHVFHCLPSLDPQHSDPAAPYLLAAAGLYLNLRGRYAEAEPLLLRALAIHEQQLGPEHPSTITSLNNLALLYSDQGRYSETEPLLLRALAIYEQQLDPQHPDTATSLNNLAILYLHQGRYSEAEPLLQRALTIYEKHLGPEHPNTAASLNNLAMLYWNQGRYAEAEPLYLRALAIAEVQLGPQHPSTAQRLNNLALLYSDQGRYSEAEPLFQRALTIYEKHLGSEHPSTTTSLNNLALLYSDQGRYLKAEPLFQRALAIREQQLGPEHPDTATSLNNLALLYYHQGRYSKAKPLFQRALAIREQQLGPEHPDTATSLNNLATLYRDQGHYAEAEPLLLRALAIYEVQLGPEHPNTALGLNNLATLYWNQRRYLKAEPLLLRALAIYQQQLGSHHPTTQTIQTNYTALLHALGRKNDTTALEQEHP